MMIYRILLFLTLGLLPGILTNAQAQQPATTSNALKDQADHSASAQAADFAQIEQAILTLFNGMRQSDSTLILSVIHPELTLQTTMMTQGGDVVIRSTPVESFVQAAGGPKDEIWDEQISDLVIQQDGPLASAWMHYRFYRGEEFSHCGVNAMMLVRQSEGWKITSIIDTRRRQDCN